MGQLAGIAASLLWAVTSLLISSAARQVGAAVVNRTRLFFAAVVLMAVHWAVLGQPLPLSADPGRWGWLGMSGLVGLVLGDMCLFQAYILIGPRLGSLSMTLGPIISTLIAWLVLGETLPWTALLGIFITVAGVAWVVMERSNGQNGQAKISPLGLLYALGAVLGQSVGTILTRRGLEGDFSTLSGVVIRITVSAAILWVIALFNGQARTTVKVLKAERRALLNIFLVSLIGPTLGVWLSLVAVQLTPVGIASTLTGLSPVFVLPLVWYFYKEKISWQTVFGTLGALVGVALLFLGK
jgi:drug/metabolite transporter (DMT)-like permease